VLKFGIVTAINPLKAQARVRFSDDEMQSWWLPVLQAKTLKDKFYSMVDVGELVACLVDENCEDGVILGAIYSSVDACPAISENQTMIRFEDRSLFEFNKETGVLTICCSKVNFMADILHTGTLENTGGIISEADITDKKSSMQAMRDVFNPHTHTGNQGAPTSKPDGEM